MRFAFSTPSMYLVILLATLVACGNGASAPSPELQGDPPRTFAAHFPEGRWVSQPCSNEAACGPFGFAQSENGPGIENCVGDANLGLLLIGRFLSIAGVPANRIARWTGERWEALGAGLDALAEGLLVHEGDVYAGGAFTRSGALSLNHVARWNPNEGWRPLGLGVDAAVRSLTVYRGELIAAGHFRNAGGAPAAGIARWDGERWWPLAGGIEAPLAGGVFAMTVYQDRLIVAGNFSAAGGVAAQNIAVWDGQSWSALQGGLDDKVYGLEAYGDELYATGDFQYAAGLPTPYVARYSQSTWAAVGSGFQGDEAKGRALTRWNDLLVAGGNFLEAGGAPAARVATWNGESWAPLGEGLNNWVEGLTTYGGKLVACGWFNALANGGPVGFATYEPSLTP